MQQDSVVAWSQINCTAIKLRFMNDGRAFYYQTF